MDFNFQAFDSHPPTSFSRHAFFSDHAIQGEWPRGRIVGPVVDRREAIEREILKERIRSEILAEEIEQRCRVREMMMERDTMLMHNNVGFTSSYMLGSPPCSNHHSRFHPEINMQGGVLAQEDIRRVISLHEIHGGGGEGYRADVGGFEVVPFQRQPQSPKMKEITTYRTKDVKKEIIGLGQPFGAPMSGLKRKLPPSPLPAGTGSSELYLDNSKKKLTEEWSCAVCQISATSEQSLNDHLAGKKHQSKMVALKGGQDGAKIGLGSNNSVDKQPMEIKTLDKCDSFDSKEDWKTEGGNTRRKLKPWCKVCQVEAPDEKNMIKHKSGKQHLKNVKRARAKSMTCRNKRC